MTIPRRTWDLGANIKCNWSTWRKKALPREEQKWLKSCEHGELGLLLYVVWVWIALARIRWWVVAAAVFLSYLDWLGGEHPRDRPHHLNLPPPHDLPLPLCQVICLDPEDFMAKVHFDFKQIIARNTEDSSQCLLDKSSWTSLQDQLVHLPASEQLLWYIFSFSSNPTRSPTCKWAFTLTFPG